MLDSATSTPTLPLLWCRSKRKWTRQSDRVIHNPAHPYDTAHRIDRRCSAILTRQRSPLDCAAVGSGTCVGATQIAPKGLAQVALSSDARAGKSPHMRAPPSAHAEAATTITRLAQGRTLIIAQRTLPIFAGTKAHSLSWGCTATPYPWHPLRDDIRA